MLSGDIAPEGLEFDGEGFCRSLENPANAIFAVSASGVADGGSGLDLGLLKHCLEYTPSRTFSRAVSAQRPPGKERLQGGPIQSSKSPETGNRGIATKGGATSILRSHLARDDFMERAMLKQLLYYDRRTPRFRPRRMTAAWVIDLGRRMRTRGCTGSRRDTIARMVVARLVEDCVRHFGNFCRLHTTIAVALHHREKDRLHCRIVVPRRRNLTSAPPPCPLPKTATESPWLPKIDGFLPYFFLREPISQHGLGRRTAQEDFSSLLRPPRKNRPICKFSKSSRKSLCSRAMEHGFQDDSVCDLLHVVIRRPRGNTVEKNRRKTDRRVSGQGWTFRNDNRNLLNRGSGIRPMDWGCRACSTGFRNRNFAEETHEASGPRRLRGHPAGLLEFDGRSSFDPLTFLARSHAPGWERRKDAPAPRAPVPHF